mmetsp:Transcript_17875/g.55500  ORF Transcript_17875/g.55500 Transcript_17875/m.55500 type:complete len:98 (+) Transcript_17875:3743-4036(+)
MPHTALRRTASHDEARVVDPPPGGPPRLVPGPPPLRSGCVSSLRARFDVRRPRLWVPFGPAFAAASVIEEPSLPHHKSFGFAAKLSVPPVMSDERNT